MREYELTTTWGLPKQSFLVTRQERERWGRIVRQWRKEHPKSTVVQQMLFESLARYHILAQRLVDNRVFFDGTPTCREEVADHKVDIDSEDLARKQKEFDKYMPLFERWRVELLKLALANGVSLQIVGDARNVSSLFGALDQTEREKLEQYRNARSGEDAQETD